MSGRETSTADCIATITRWGVGALFIYMGSSKAMDPVGFLKLVRQYDLPFYYGLLNGIAVTLPWFEIVCGVLLVMGVAVRGTALLTLGMLVPFTIVVLFRGLEIAGAKGLALCAVKFDCGCGAGEVYVCAKITENVLLSAACAWLVAGAGRRTALRYELIRTRHERGQVVG